MKQYYLGIDTSCYTTSCAIIDKSGHIVKEARKLLEVSTGSKGLQQSNMVFQHTKALPILLKELPPVQLKGIGVSAFPRRADDSYMPAFLVGHGMATSLGHLLQVPVYEFAHQENHILAALRLMDSIPNKPFMALHLSGGTTELVLSKYMGYGIFKTEIIGGSRDLQGGQFVDRIGVALGLDFPAGKALEQLALQLEQLALQADEYESLPSSVKEGWISFSGPCSEALRRISPQTDKSSMAKSVFACIGNSLEKLITYHQKEHNVDQLIAVGGVMSNSILRNRVKGFCNKLGVSVYFAEPRYSVDNATGNAYGALLATKEL